MHVAQKRDRTTGKNLLKVAQLIGNNLLKRVSEVPARLDRRRALLVGGAALVIGAVAWIAFELDLGRSIANANTLADRRLALFDRTLEANIERFRYLPEAVAQSEESHAVLENPDERSVEAANGFLSRINETAGADEIFVMNAEGEVVAASNWWTLTSLVGEDYSFRPYYAEAMEHGAAKYYAYGLSTSVPGYFLSERIEGPDGAIGVAVAKVNLGEIEAVWWRSGELIGILDVNGVAILSTRPDWRYRPLLPMDPARAQRVASEARYGENGIENRSILADRWPSRGTEFAYIAGTDPEASGYFLVRELRLPTHGWRIASFTPAGPIFANARTSAAAAGLGTAALLLLIGLLVQRQRTMALRLADHDRLELRVAQRTAALHAANERLRAEIAERQRAEQARRDAQEGLVQSAKLASLGQALAGVAHEISQPVAALATHLASARLLETRRPDPETSTILAAMDRVVQRLSALTGHLKTFARKQDGQAQSCELTTAIEAALELAEHRLRALEVTVRFEPPASSIIVRGNPIHIEQALINLISNACDAMETGSERVLDIELIVRDATATIAISDTGPGIAPGDLPNLFDPFFTTKQAGKGLGLGLSISYALMGDMGGTITAENLPEGGARFRIVLPVHALLSAQPKQLEVL
jgi:two-component system C4-dicarboxylate transport sensor histidine kinase DctB